jgi:hypothetical protein
MGGVAGAQFSSGIAATRPRSTRRHPAIRCDDRREDAGAVPDGVFRPRRRAGASDIIYKRSASKCYRVDVKDTLPRFHGHESLGWAAAPARACGKIDPSRAADIPRLVVREFLRGNSQAAVGVPEHEAGMPDVTVVELKR